MAGTKAVHQCLFCPRIFDNAVEKDDHILEHFPQETCTDCDQSLIRIGNSLYTLHNAVTCIKRESKPSLNCLHEIHTESINENKGAIEVSKIICGQYVDIKPEPGIEQNKHAVASDSMNFGASINENSTEFNSTDIDFTPSNTVSVQQLDAKSNSDAGISFDRLECEKCKIIFKRREYLNKHMKLKHDPNFIKFDCDFCWAFFKSKESLEHHHRFFCKRIRKSSKEFPSNDKFITTTDEDHIDQSQQVRAKNTTEKSWVTNDTESIECNSSVDITSLKVISLQDLDIKMEPETQDEQLIPENVKNFHEPNDINFHSNQMFRSQSHTIASANSHPGGDKFECRECDAVYKRKEYLSKHMKFKHNPNLIKYTCQFCFVVFMSPISLIKHQNQFCIERKRKLTNKTSGHEKMEANVEETQSKNNDTDKSLTCELCSKKLANKGSLKTHKFLVHNVGDLHSCIHCKDVYRTERGLRKHEPKCAKLSKRSFECFLCHKFYKSKKNVIIHLRMVHVPYRKKFRCQICKIYIHCKLEYAMHMNQIHLDTRNFVCFVCGMAFKRRSVWRQHEMSHSGGIKCKHEGCQKIFKSQTVMYAHMRIHRGQKKFRCRINGCTEQFGGIAGYKKHKLSVHGVPITK